MNTRTRSQTKANNTVMEQSKHINTNMEQSKPINTNMEDNTEIMKMYQNIAYLDQLLVKMRQEQISKVIEFRELCLQRKQQNQPLKCNACKNDNTSNPFTNRRLTHQVRVKPIGITGNYTLRGDYENNLYICGECGRPCIELRSINSDNGYEERRYL